MENATYLIPLTQGEYATVDAIDYKWAMQSKWSVQKRKTTRGFLCYAIRNIKSNSKYKTSLMHREIAKRAGLPDAPEYDHKDRNGLNNSRQNLRTSTRSEACANRTRIAGASSQYKGVTWHKKTGKWAAQICYHGKKMHLGLFVSEIEAAAMYAAYAIFFWGEFACFS